MKKEQPKRNRRTFESVRNIPLEKLLGNFSEQLAEELSLRESKKHRIRYATHLFAKELGRLEELFLDSGDLN